MSVLWLLQQTVSYAIQKDLCPENKWRRILCRVHDVWRVHREMPVIRCHQTHFLRKDFDGIETFEMRGNAVYCELTKPSETFRYEEITITNRSNDSAVLRLREWQ